MNNLLETPQTLATSPDVAVLSSDAWLQEPELPLHIVLTRQPDLAPHMHTFIELVMVVSGSGTHLFKTEHYPITAGDVFVIPPRTPHGYTDTEGLTIFNILFEETVLDRFRSELEILPGFHGLIYLEPYYRSVRGIAGRLTLRPDQVVQAQSLIKRLEAELAARYEGRRVMVQALFTELLVFFCRCFSHDDGPAAHVMPVARVIGYMTRHFAEALTLDILADVAGLSKRSLIRHFKQTTGSPPMRYLQAVRIAKARDLLLSNTDLTITEVAIRVGFNDPAYFATLFKRHTGTAPSRYRHTAQSLA